ncbi:MAG: MqnA/MqnD/SBP family protein [Angelakisella sp.]|nr:MqnA/MqnD/SBP family protein [Angelakisella sp.]
MKKILALLLAIALCVGITACGAPAESSSSQASTSASQEAPSSQTPETEPVDIRIAALKGPTAMGMVKLMSDNEEGKTSNSYTVDIYGTADELTPKLISGELDMAAVPCNLASVLYNKTNGSVQLAAINTLGVLYIVETGNSIQSVEDLKGKTIYSTGKGTTPEYALNYVLTQNGIDPAKDVTIEYKSESTEVAALLAEGENVIAMLPQPYVTTVALKNEKLRIALDMTKEWQAAAGEGGSGLVTGVLVVRKEFAQQNKAAFDAFLDEYKASAEYVAQNTDEAAPLVAKYDIVPEPVAKKALPYCNISYIDGEEMVSRAGGYLKVLFEQNPKSVGGALPDDSFYYTR